MVSNPELVLEGLCAEANQGVSSRLKAIHNVIRGFKKNNVELTAPNVVNALGALGIKMSSSSIYNKNVRGKPNPYRVLYDAWNQDISTATEKRSETKRNTLFTEMTDDDYQAIKSDVLKFKIENMYSELKSLRHQINLLKDIHELPILQEQKGALVFLDSRQPSTGKPLPELIQSSGDNNTEEYIEILETFIQGSSKVSFDEDGCLSAKTMIRKDDVLSDMELYHAIVASIRSLKN